MQVNAFMFWRQCVETPSTLCDSSLHFGFDSSNKLTIKKNRFVSRTHSFCFHRETVYKMNRRIINDASQEGEICLLLIELIKQMEILYNPSHPDSNNSGKRSQAWKHITSVINENFPCDWSKCDACIPPEFDSRRRYRSTVSLSICSYCKSQYCLVFYFLQPWTSPDGNGAR